MSAKFTPGPWEMFYFTRHELQTDFAMVKIGKNALMVGRLEEDCANAHLIAAAPEMYEVIEEIAGMKTPYCDAYDAANYMRDAARALLAKMRGEA